MISLLDFHVHQILNFSDSHLTRYEILIKLWSNFLRYYSSDLYYVSSSLKHLRYLK